MLFFRMYRNFFVFILCKKKCGVCFHRLISFFKAETFSWVFLSLPECSGGSLPSLLSPTAGTGLSLSPVSGFPLFYFLPQGKVANLTGVIPTTLGHFTGVQGRCSMGPISSPFCSPMIYSRPQAQCDGMKQILYHCLLFRHRAPRSFQVP